MRRYPGPIAFSTEQESLFFGREDDIKELSELIFVERKVLLYSKSGYGKSSLLNAGVEPTMVKVNNNFEFIKIRFYDGSNSNVTPNDRFLMTVKQNADFVNAENQKTIIDIYAKDFLHEYWSVFKKNQMAGNDNKTYILIFDQFEELFSYPTEQINEFKNRLTDILLLNRPPRFFTNFEKEIFRDESSIDSAQLDQLYQPVNIKVVFSIRSDRLSELNRLTDKIPDIQKVFYELKPLSEEQLRKAIEIPAKNPKQYDSSPFTFTPKAVDKIITALTLEGKKTVSTTTLQIICQRIEGDFLPKEDGKKEYILKNNMDNIIEAEELPDFKDIFLDFYNQSVAKIETDTPESVRIFIEDALISNEGTRISLDQSLCRPYVSEETLKTLVGTKLINVERNSVDSFSYELSHDTFIPSIKEMKDERIKHEEEKRLEAEKQEDLRIAKENAEKERVEWEKVRKRQRKTITIVSFAALVSIICAGFGLLGFVKAKNGEKKIKETTIQYYMSDAQHNIDNKEYEMALKRYNSLRVDILEGDTMKILDNAITECQNLIEKQKLYESFMVQGKDSIEAKNFKEAIDCFIKAKNTRINNQQVDLELVKVKNILSERIKELRENINYSDKENDKIKWQTEANELEELIQEISQVIN